MIIEKMSVLTKKELLIYTILYVVQISVGVIIISLFFIIYLCSDGFDGTLFINTIVIALASIYSIGEAIWKKSKSRNALFQTIFFKLIKMRKSWIEPTKNQITICKQINEGIKRRNILFSGKELSGKTTTVFIYLSCYVKDKEIYSKLKWSNNIIYIDCKDNKQKIIDFFNKPDLDTSTLTIIDNIERMGTSFTDDFMKNIVKSKYPCILLIDVESVEKYNSKNLVNISMNRIGVGNENTTFSAIFTRLSKEEKLVLLTIYHVSFSVTLISIENLIQLLNFTRHFLKKTLKVLKKKNLITTFPLDKDYYLLINKMDMLNNKSIFINCSENIEALKYILNKKVFYPELAWLSYIQLDKESLNSVKVNKIELFNNAMLNGNYSEMLKQLLEELNYASFKSNLFYYELGTLYFYNSQQANAVDEFTNYIKNISNPEDKIKGILRMIESTHGDANSDIVENNNKYIKELLESKSLNHYYGKYWNLHIESEKGNFYLDEYKELLTNLLNVSNKDIKLSDIHTEIIKRCYTDIIRTHNILYKKPSESLLSNFETFMKVNYGNSACRYYKALYIDASTNHYFNLLSSIFSDKNCQDIIKSAESGYKEANQVEYQNVKSITASKLKWIDLLLYKDATVNFEECEKIIKQFQNNAAINMVTVHEAYCQTLMMKLKIVKLLGLREYLLYPDGLKKEIEFYFSESKKMYGGFKNTYGVFRVDFLYKLYDMYFEKSEYDLSPLYLLVSKHDEYSKEKEIYKMLKNLVESNNLNRMKIFALIKAYPIIMQ